MSLRAVERLSLGVTVGLGVAGLVAWVLILGWSRQPWLTIPAGLAGLVAGVVAARWGGQGDRADRLPAWLGAIAAVVLVVLAVVFAARLRAEPEGGWDATMIWNLRARLLLRADPITAAFPASPVLSHADYPLLLPAIVASGWLAIGEGRAWPAIVAVAFALACAGLLAAAVGRVRGAAWGVGAALVCGSCPVFVASAASECADLPVAAFLLVAAIALTADRPSLSFAGFALSLAAATKNEGLLYLGAAAVMVLLAARGGPWRDRVRRGVVLLAGAAPVLLLIAWFKLRWAPANDLVALSTAGGVFERLVDPARIGRVALAFLRHAAYFQIWGIAPLAVLGVLVVRGRNFVWREHELLLGGFVALSAAGLAIVFVLTPQDLAWHLSSALDRVLLQLWPVLILLFSRVIATRDGET